MTPLLDVVTLEFRPYEPKMNGWFVWRLDKHTKLEGHTLMHVNKYTAAIGLPFKGKRVIGEFAGPVI